MQKEKQGNGNGNGKFTMTRRDFLKTTAAAGAGGGILTLSQGFDNALGVAPVTAAAVGYTAKTTCPFCSVGCGQLVDVDVSGNNVIDVYGDPNHVTNLGANCPKGAAALQIVNGDRRIGVPGNVLGITGPVYRNGTDTTWTAYANWDSAIKDVAVRLKSARDAAWPAATGTYTAGDNTKSVAFLGCSHATNEENWVYRKLIANVGTNNTEHQARI